MVLARGDWGIGMAKLSGRVVKTNCTAEFNLYCMYYTHLDVTGTLKEVDIISWWKTWKQQLQISRRHGDSRVPINPRNLQNLNIAVQKLAIETPKCRKTSLNLSRKHCFAFTHHGTWYRADQLIIWSVHVKPDGVIWNDSRDILYCKRIKFEWGNP